MNKNIDVSCKILRKFDLLFSRNRFFYGFHSELKSFFSSQKWFITYLHYFFIYLYFTQSWIKKSFIKLRARRYRKT